jgi:HEAT repeat protein
MRFDAVRAQQIQALLLTVLISGCAGAGSTEHWLAQLQAGEASVRLQAIKALGERKGEAAVVVPALVKSLKDDNAFVRRDAAQALGGMGRDAQPAVPGLLALLQDKNANVRRVAARAVKQIDPGRSMK